MIHRNARHKMLEMAKKFPVLVFTGPRQSGKTTLAKLVFSNYRYVSLENPDQLEFALSDPLGFLNTYDKYVIIDEAQNAPQLFSYIQQIVDESGLSGQFILSGSQNFLLLEKITQSLAGRVYLMELLPLSQDEIATVQENDVYESIIKGSYPRVYDKDISPRDFYPGYIRTYVERDVKTIVNVQDVSLFRKFLSLLAHHVGQLFNASSISKELGVDSKTVQRWLSILESSYIVFTLQPWYANLSRRIVKTPKLYFYDTGLVAYLLGIKKADNLLLSTYKGALFENYCILEIMKSHKNSGIYQDFYFWRDSNGNEIDLLLVDGMNVSCYEMKASQTVKSEYLKALHYLDTIANYDYKHYLLNTMETNQNRSNESIISWKNIFELNYF
jgi:predicted AAA+ superfamily ATPase